MQEKQIMQIMTTDEMRAIDSVNDSMMVASMEYFSREGFKWIEVPVVNSCKSMDTAKAGQLYLEAKVPIHKRVWTTLPGLEERFQIIDFEHEGDFEILIKNIQETVGSMIKKVLERNSWHLRRLGKDTGVIEKYLPPYQRISYSQAVELLWGTPLELTWGEELEREHEVEIVERMGGRPLFITHWPKELKDFNVKISDKDDSLVNSADLLMPGYGRVAYASERENDYKKLAERLAPSEFYTIINEEEAINEIGCYLRMVEKNPLLHSGCTLDFGGIAESILDTH